MAPISLLLAALGSAWAIDVGPVEDCDVRSKDVGRDEVHFITIGPGPAPYSFLGHAALWIRSPSRGMNHIIEYGAFDSSKQEPFSNLMLGTLQCRWKVIFAHRGEARYEREDRHAIAQRLHLPPEAEELLLDDLRELASRTKDSWQTFHWRERSCASEARDYIDQGTGGQFRAALAGEAPLTPRGEVLRHVGLHPWAWMGLHALSGMRVDRPQTRYAAGFVPERMAEELAAFELTWPDGSTRPLVDQTCRIHNAGNPWPLPEPPKWLPWTALLGLLGAGAAWGMGRRADRGARGARLLLGLGVGLYGLVVGVLGLASMVFAATSALEAYRDNLGWLVMHPGALLFGAAGIAWARGRRPRWALALTLICTFGAVVALPALIFSPQQWLEPWTVFALPLFGLAAWQLGPTSSDEPLDSDPGGDEIG